MEILNHTERIYRLNPNAHLVKGSQRSMICDLERSFYKLIPNSLARILRDKNCMTIREALDNHAKDRQDEEAILGYFVFLLDHDLLFFTEYPEYYANISLDWDRPSIITNALIDIDEKSDIKLILNHLRDLAALGCRNIQMRFFANYNLHVVQEIAAGVEGELIESFQFIMPYHNNKSIAPLTAMIQQFPRIRFVQLYGAPNNAVLYSSEDESTLVVTVKSHLINEKCCGVISSHYFSIALATFTESHHHNSCLNRKISIDAEGNIKNCPSMKESYGNIRDTTLMEALEKPGFKKYWNITKDQVSVYKDCEFRYICTDCRAYLEDPEEIYSKPLKCGYNPYTCEWEEWSTNPLKQQAIDYYGMREILPEFARQKPSDAPSSDAP